LQKSYCVTGVQPRLSYTDTMNTQCNTLVALLATGLLVAGCGAASSTTGQSGVQNASAVSLNSRALAYVNCMRTHGEPNMPDPTFSGRHATLAITPSSGVDPTSPQFSAATKACQHLVPQGGAATGGPAITPAQQADYLKAVACMRSHGFPAFPDPVFQNNNVTFNAAGSRIDTNSSRYKRALTTCQKVIPAGLPDSSSGGS
jgi:hypothetical protein